VNKTRVIHINTISKSLIQKLCPVCYLLLHLWGSKFQISCIYWYCWTYILNY